jgi:hypothetical protein
VVSAGLIADVRSIAYSGTHYIACGVSGGTVFSTSIDGLTWTAYATATDLTQGRGIATNDKGTWIAVGYNSSATTGKSIIRSTDNGANWTTTTGDIFEFGNDVVWNGTRWIAVGSRQLYNVPTLLVSEDDGLNWTSTGVTQLLTATGNGVATANIFKTYPTTSAQTTTLFNKLLNDLYAARGSIAL